MLDRTPSGVYSIGIFIGRPVDGIEVAVDKSMSQEPAGQRLRPKGDTAEMQAYAAHALCWARR